MPSHDPEIYKDKIEVSLDGRQIFYLFFGGAVIVGLVFVLGVMVGRRVEARGHLDRADPQAARDPLAALDRLEQSDDLSFHGALTGAAVPTEVEKAIGEIERRRAAGRAGQPGKPPPAASASPVRQPEKPAQAAAGPAAQSDAPEQVASSAAAPEARAARPESKPAPAAGIAAGITAGIEPVDRPRADRRDRDAPGVEKRDIDKREVEKRAIDKRDIDKREVEKRDIDKRDIDKREVEKRDIDKRAIEKRDIDKRELDKHEVDKQGGDQKARKHDDGGSVDVRQDRSDAKKSPGRSEPATREARSDAKKSPGRSEPATREARSDAKTAAAEPRSEPADGRAPRAARSEGKPSGHADAKPGAKLDARAGEGKTRFTLQLASFRDKGEAETFLGAMRSAGFQPHLVADAPGKGALYRVRLGSYRSLEAASDARAEYERKAKKTAQIMQL